MENGPMWTAFASIAVSVVVAIAAHLKNMQQDKASLKRDTRILTLEIDHERCEKDRVRLLEQIQRMKESKEDRENRKEGA